MNEGVYLVENVAGCAQSHTGRTITFGLDSEKPYAGEKGLTGDFAPAIDQARMNALPSASTFVDGVLVKGNKLNGSPIAASSMKLITQGNSQADGPGPAGHLCISGQQGRSSPSRK